MAGAHFAVFVGCYGEGDGFYSVAAEQFFVAGGGLNFDQRDTAGNGFCGDYQKTL